MYMSTHVCKLLTAVCLDTALRVGIRVRAGGWGVWVGIGSQAVCVGLKRVLRGFWLGRS